MYDLLSNMYYSFPIGYSLLAVPYWLFPKAVMNGQFNVDQNLIQRVVDGEMKDSGH